MQEIDFDPSGNGSAMGDIPFPRSVAVHTQNSSTVAGDSLNYHNPKHAPRDLNGIQFEDHAGLQDDGDYVENTGHSPSKGYPGYGTGIQRAYSSGSSAAGSRPFYGDTRHPPPPNGYEAYSSQYPATSAHYDVPPVPYQSSYGYGSASANYDGAQGADYHQRNPRNLYQTLPYQASSTRGPAPSAAAVNCSNEGGTLSYGNMVSRATTPPPPGEITNDGCRYPGPPAAR